MPPRLDDGAALRPFAIGAEPALTQIAPQCPERLRVDRLGDACLEISLIDLAPRHHRLAPVAARHDAAIEQIGGLPWLGAEWLAGLAGADIAREVIPFDHCRNINLPTQRTQ